MCTEGATAGGGGGLLVLGTTPGAGGRFLTFKILLSRSQNRIPNNIGKGLALRHEITDINNHNYPRSVTPVLSCNS